MALTARGGATTSTTTSRSTGCTAALAWTVPRIKPSTTVTRSTSSPSRRSITSSRSHSSAVGSMVALIVPPSRIGLRRKLSTKHRRRDRFGVARGVTDYRTSVRLSRRTRRRVLRLLRGATGAEVAAVVVLPVAVHELRRVDPEDPRGDRLGVVEPRRPHRFSCRRPGQPLAAMWRLALMTGMPRGELHGLRSQHVDLAAGVVSVRQGHVRGNGLFAFGAEVRCVQPVDAGRRRDGRRLGEPPAEPGARRHGRRMRSRRSRARSQASLRGRRGVGPSMSELPTPLGRRRPSVG